jgi:hypothetical protein
MNHCVAVKNTRKNFLNRAVSKDIHPARGEFFVVETLDRSSLMTVI